jgi:hypothetical protein
MGCFAAILADADHIPPCMDKNTGNRRRNSLENADLRAPRRAAGAGKTPMARQRVEKHIHTLI